MEEALIAYLLADAGVAALVATRVTPGKRTQGGDLPAIVFHLVSGAPEYDDQGTTGLVDSTIQIDCWASTYTGAKLVARAVKAALQDFDGTIDGVEFQAVFLEAERDFAPSGGGQAEYLHRTSLDFNPWHT